MSEPSVFDGTWRPNYEAPGPDAPPDVLSLVDGIFECRSWEPPLRVDADGRFHAIEGNPRFETIAVSVLDARTVRQVGRRGDVVVLDSTTTVAPDGRTKTETRTASMLVDDELVTIMATVPDENDGAPKPVLFRIVSERVGAVTPGVHPLTGSWRIVELDLVNHDEDTTYRIVDGRMSMADRLGRSFDAPLDGTEAPYHGDVRFTTVSVRTIDERTIEESNLNGEAVVQVTRWQVDPDGRTIHVRFDDLHGHVMTQTGHKLP